MTRELQGEFFTRENTGLFSRAHIPEQVNGVLVYQHGIGEHSGRYWPLVDTLLPEGLACFGLDSPGHGRSPGQRGDAPSIAALTDGLADFIKYIEQNYNYHRVHLFGHSMGGLIVLDLAERYPELVRSVIASGSGLKIRLTPMTRIKRLLGEPISGLLPRLKMKTGLDARELTHSEKEVQAYLEDPLVHGFVSARLGLDLMDYGATVLERIPQIQIPALFLHGELDRITMPDGSREAASLYSGPTGNPLRIYDGCKHEVMNEVPDGRKKYLDDILGFLSQLPKDE